MIPSSQISGLHRGSSTIFGVSNDWSTEEAMMPHDALKVAPSQCIGHILPLAKIGREAFETAHLVDHFLSFFRWNLSQSGDFFYYQNTREATTDCIFHWKREATTTLIAESHVRWWQLDGTMKWPFERLKGSVKNWNGSRWFIYTWECDLGSQAVENPPNLNGLIFWYHISLSDFDMAKPTFLR